MGYIVILQNTPLKRDRACSVNIISFLPQPPLKRKELVGEKLFLSSTTSFTAINGEGEKQPTSTCIFKEMENVKL